jgi:hypothetical protein
VNERTLNRWYAEGLKELRQGIRGRRNRRGSEAMSEGTGEAKSGQSPRDAVDWFVENESDREPDPMRLREWEAWSASPQNRADYAEIIWMREEARTLSVPPTASRQELLADIADEASVASIIRPWD